MSRQAIELCANAKWMEGDPRFWPAAYGSRQPRHYHVAQHLSPSEASFRIVR